MAAAPAGGAGAGASERTEFQAALKNIKNRLITYIDSDAAESKRELLSSIAAPLLNKANTEEILETLQVRFDYISTNSDLEIRRAESSWKRVFTGKPGFKDYWADLNKFIKQYGSYYLTQADLDAIKTSLDATGKSETFKRLHGLMVTSPAATAAASFAAAAGAVPAPAAASSDGTGVLGRASPSYADGKRDSHSDDGLAR